MGRRKSLDPTIPLELSLPESLHTKVTVLLWSTVENRVPLGGYSNFFIERIREFFSWRRLPLEPYGLPEGYFIAGPKEMIDRVEAALTQWHAVIKAGEQRG